MDKKLMRSILVLITYTGLLVLVLLKADVLWSWAGRVLHGMRPLFIGFAIAFVLNRPCALFERMYARGLQGGRGERAIRPMAVLTSYVLLLVVLTALVSFVLPKVGDSVRLFADGLGGYVANLQAWINELSTRLDYEALDLSWLSTYLKGLLDGVLSSAKDAINHLMMLTSGVLSLVVTLVLAIVFSIYMLAGQHRLSAQCGRVIRAYLPPKYVDYTMRVVRLTADTFTNFVSGQIIEACILGMLCAGGMFFIQADYAPLIGVIVGTSALIPVAGAYIGAILSAFLLLMISPVRALVFLAFLCVLQQIEGNVIYPRVVGTSIGLPGIWVLTAVTLGGSLFGLLGVLLSVPVASVLYTLLRQDVRRRLERREQREQQPGDSLDKR